MTRFPLRPVLAVVSLLVPFGATVRAQSSLDLLLSSTGTGQVVRIAPGGGAGSASNFAAVPPPSNAAYGVIADGTGAVYFSTSGTDVYRRAPDGVVTSLATGFNGADGLAFGPDKNLYVADFTSQSVKRIDMQSGSVSTFATGFGRPTALAFDSAGNLYVGDSGNDKVVKVSSNGATQTTFATGYATSGSIRELAFDSAGKLYATSVNGQSTQDGVYKVGATGGTASRLITLGHAYGLAFDEHGVLYASADNSVLRYDPTTGGLLNVYAADANLIQGAGYINFAPVPEPASGLLACAAAGGVDVFGRRVRRAVTRSA
jgi:sugar lactone lactonase YvrE